MSLLIEDNDLIDIKVYYRARKSKSGAKRVEVLTPEKAKEMLADDEKKDQVDEANFKCKQPAWADQNRLFADSSRYNPQTGKETTDWSVYSDLQLKSSIVDWDLKDDNDREIPVSEDYIDRLPANIASEILAQYRKAVLIGDDEGEG
jgi:hypothetical protein